MRYEINAKLFNAVCACQAKDDVRYYLNAFFLCAEHYELVATNGHIMAIAPIEPQDGQKDWADCDVPAGKNSGAGWIFYGVEKPLLKSIETVIIDTDEKRLELVGLRYKGPRYIALEQMDGSYVNYRSVKAERDTKELVQAERGFNTEYLYRCFRWAGIPQHQSTVRMIAPKSASDGIELRPISKELFGLHITLMPCRF